MNEEITLKDIINEIHSAEEKGKPNTTIGMFMADAFRDGTEKEFDKLVVRKPLINISPFVVDSEIYYSVVFNFKSRKDADYKQMWQFLCRHVERYAKALQAEEEKPELDVLPTLTITILPDRYAGKYFILAHLPIEESFSITENAFENSATVSFSISADSFHGLSADDDIIDRNSIEREVEVEIENEYENELDSTQS